MTSRSFSSRVNKKKIRRLQGCLGLRRIIEVELASCQEVFFHSNARCRGERLKSALFFGHSSKKRECRCSSFAAPTPPSPPHSPLPSLQFALHTERALSRERAFLPLAPATCSLPSSWVPAPRVQHPHTAPSHATVSLFHVGPRRAIRLRAW